jgi:hypothetical protein
MNLRSAIYPLHVIVAALKRSGLAESVLIGNMAAAVHGASVLTDDFDYLVPPFADLPRRIRALAKVLGAVVLPPKKHPYGTTTLFIEDTNIQIDLLRHMDGISSFRALRTRARPEPKLDDTVVASLRDIITSKRAAGRPKDFAVLPELEATLHEIEKKNRKRPAVRR